MKNLVQICIKYLALSVLLILVSAILAVMVVVIIGYFFQLSNLNILLISALAILATAIILPKLLNWLIDRMEARRKNHAA